MTAHNLVNMITAKANNMNLVVFCKYGIKGRQKWIVKDDQDSTEFRAPSEYFLCLPQHKEEVLHVLNGGIVQITTDSHWNNPQEIERAGIWLGNDFIWYMSPYCQSRTKPKKEKRWIVLSPPIVDSTLYLSADDAKKTLCRHNQWQVIEIEIEV